MDVIGPVMENTALLLPGVMELKLLSGHNDTNRAVELLFGNPILEMIVLKQGKAGATIFTREERFETHAYPVQDVDPTGAGDCFDAGFLCGFLEGKSIEDCGQIAAAAGALNAAAFGPMEGDISPSSIQDLITG